MFIGDTVYTILF